MDYVATMEDVGCCDDVSYKMLLEFYLLSVFKIFVDGYSIRYLFRIKFYLSTDILKRIFLSVIRYLFTKASKNGYSCT